MNTINEDNKNNVAQNADEKKNEGNNGSDNNAGSGETKPNENKENAGSTGANNVGTGNNEELREKVEKLELKDYLRDKAPQLAGSYEEIHGIRKANPSMKMEDVIALHMGRTIISSAGQGGGNTVVNKPINIMGAPEKNYKEMSDEELFAQAQKEMQDAGLM